MGKFQTVKIFLLGFLTASVLFVSLIATHAATAALGNIKLFVEGKQVYADPPPFIQNDRTFVPLRFVAEALGKSVKYDANTQTVYVGGDSGAGVTLYSDILPSTGNKIDFSNKQTEIGGKTYKAYYSELFTDSAFNLNGQYNVLKISAGYNTSSVTRSLKIKGDGKLLKEITCEDMAKGEMKEFSINIRGVNKLEIDAFDIVFGPPVVE